MWLALFFCWLCTGVVAADDGCSGIVAGTSAGFAQGQYTPFCSQGTAYAFTVSCPVTVIENVPDSGYSFKITAESKHMAAYQSIPSAVYPFQMTFEEGRHKLVIDALAKTKMTYDGQPVTCDGGIGSDNISISCSSAAYTITTIHSLQLILGRDTQKTPFFQHFEVAFQFAKGQKARGFLGTPGQGTNSPFVLPDGTTNQSTVAVQNAWTLSNIGGYPSGGCTFAYPCDVGADCYGTPQRNQSTASTTTNCKMLNNDTGDLGICWKFVPHDVIGTFYKNCIEDPKSLTDKSTVCSDHLYPFLSACRAYAILAGQSVSSAKNPCPRTHNCPANSHFNDAASACVNTCVKPFASDHCVSSQTEARCDCDYFSDVAHYVYQEGRCVHVSQC